MLLSASIEYVLLIIQVAMHGLETLYDLEVIYIEIQLNVLMNRLLFSLP